MNEEKKQGYLRDHLANERTFLAWIRTSIGIMAFGFVVEKFALFIKSMSLILGKSNIENASPPSHGYSAIVGIFLVGFGTLMGLLAFVTPQGVPQKYGCNREDRSERIIDALQAYLVRHYRLYAELREAFVAV